MNGIEYIFTISNQYRIKNKKQLIKYILNSFLYVGYKFIRILIYTNNNFKGWTIYLHYLGNKSYELENVLKVHTLGIKKKEIKINYNKDELIKNLNRYE